MRQLFAEGKVGRDALLESEAQSYHSAGTCTFYGTANSNQVLMEVMGLHLPGAAFVPPNTSLRAALTSAAAKRAVAITALGNEYLPIASVVDERAIVNAIVALLGHPPARRVLVRGHRHAPIRGRSHATHDA